MIPEKWLSKPYFSLDAYCKATYHHKCYKIALNAHMSCPNRDGTLDTRGCIFCSEGGSGEFAVDGLMDINAQIQAGLSLFGDKKVGQHFIAYFQAYTNTYAPLAYLRQVYTKALSHPLICGISIATRPDCLPDEVLFLLTELQKNYPEKFIWVELGLQTACEKTADYIRRGYPLRVFTDACNRLSAMNIPTIIHVILGLPGETEETLYSTIEYINLQKPFGVKLQLLHILKNTDLEKEYLAGKVSPLTKEGYLQILTQCLERLSPEIVIHRLTGDGPKDLMLAPSWSLNKRDVLNSLHRYMKEKQSYQGKHFSHHK